MVQRTSLRYGKHDHFFFRGKHDEEIKSKNHKEKKLKTRKRADKAVKKNTQKKENEKQDRN